MRLAVALDAHRREASQQGFASDDPSSPTTLSARAVPACSWTELSTRGHFCLDLHVAMQFRPFHHPSCDGALVVVVEVGGEPPNLLIVRTGQIVTAHINAP